MQLAGGPSEPSPTSSNAMRPHAATASTATTHAPRTRRVYPVPRRGCRSIDRAGRRGKGLRRRRFSITRCPMTFRDDHEAALERADAAERELERERDKSERTQDELEDTQAALERERAERKRLEGLVGVRKPDPVAREAPFAHKQLDPAWDPVRVIL